MYPPPKMDYTHGTGRRAGRRNDLCVLCGMLCMLMAFVTILTFTVLSYLHHGGISRCVEGDLGFTREVPRPGHPKYPEPDDQLAMESGNVPEELVVQEGQLHARSDDPARRYAEQEQVADGDMDADEVPGAQDRRRQFKLPKLPIPSDILDLPIKIPTRISEIIGDLPLPTIPTNPGDIISNLPTDPGELISDLPIPTLPSIPAIPTLPIPIPIPTKVPDLPLPVPTGTDLPGIPLPTVVPPPGKPKDPGNPYKLPDLTEIPHKVMNLLHEAISKLSTSKDTPKYFRDVLRVILQIINRVAGGHPNPVPGDPWPKPTLPVPTGTKLPLPTLPVPTPPVPTLTLPLPTLPFPTLPFPTLPVPTLPPLPTSLPKTTLTLPHLPKPPGKDGDGNGFVRAVKVVRDEGEGGEEPLSDERLKQLRASVADEVWAAADWSNPLAASLTAAAAMLAFDAVYAVAGQWKETDDEAEKERLLGLLVVVDDEDDEQAVA